MAETLLEIDDLRTWFRTKAGVVRAVDGVSLSIDKGKTVGLVGESGCGKSVLAQSILQIQTWPGEIEGGRVILHGDNGAEPEVLTDYLPKAERLRQIRGNRIAYIHQEPMAALSLLHTVGNQLREAVLVHHPEMSKDQANEIAVKMLGDVGIPRAETRLDSYIFNFSGGMRQRVMIAMALINHPRLLIADEPTTAIDVTIQAQVLELMRDIQQRFDMSVLFITHDLAVIAEIAEEVVVMYLGRVVERTSVTRLFENPKHPYTQALIGSLPSGEHERGALASIRGTVPDPYSRPTGCAFRNRCDHFIEGVCDRNVPALVELETDHVVRCFLHSEEIETGAEPDSGVADEAAAAGGSIGRHRRAAAQPAGDVPTGDAAAGDGEGTPGARAAVRPPGAGGASVLAIDDLRTWFPIRKGFFRRHAGWIKAVDGISFEIRERETVSLVGESGCGKSTTARSIVRAVEPTGGNVRFHARDGAVLDVTDVDRDQINLLRQQVRMLFQDPFQSLNPRFTVVDIVGEPLRNFGVADGEALRERVGELLEDVGLDARHMGRYPHAFSGGQRQRIGLARALTMNPRLLLADEPTSALDVSVKAQILNLMQKLQDEHGLSYLFITHELGIVRHFSDRCGVMYLGRIVEMGTTEAIFREPLHPYTEALLSAAPVPNPRAKMDRIILQGDVPDPADAPPGCPFHTRCPYAEERCKTEAPALQPIEDGSDHTVACLRAEELELRGVRW